ncbi:MAG: type II toxin-antitoxin system prevent-host-death family antitoxin [Clostridiales bacterium]|nr:type II toxin-antitoxin system prevent-host-death family antitoxin [Clostridiales bacterium]
MKSTTASVAEGKRSFSRLIQEANEKKREIIVTRRGKPVAAIVSYEEYERGRSAYDASYLALAEEESAIFITADRTLFGNVKEELAWVKWLGDVLRKEAVAKNLKLNF